MNNSSPITNHTLQITHHALPQGINHHPELERVGRNFFFERKALLNYNVLLIICDCRKMKLLREGTTIGQYVRDFLKGVVEKKEEKGILRGIQGWSERGGGKNG